MQKVQEMPLRDPDYVNTIFKLNVWDDKRIMLCYFTDFMGSHDEYALAKAWCTIVEWLRKEYGYNPKIHQCDVYNPVALLERKAIENVDFVIFKKALFVRADKLIAGDVICSEKMIQYESLIEGKTFKTSYLVSVYHTVIDGEWHSPLHYEGIFGGARWDAFQADPLAVAEWHKPCSEWRWKEQS